MKTTNSAKLLSEQNDWPGGFGNWGRWANQRGTLNLITPAKVLAAAKTVELGKVFTCSVPLTPEFYPEELRKTHNFDSQGFHHEMLSADVFDVELGKYAAQDKFSLSVHSLENTHIDALSHVGHHGKAFNGVDFFEMVTMADKAKLFDVSQLQGIVTRAVLVDVPRIRGVEFLKPGDSVTAADLEAGASNLEPGDALLVRTGRWRAPVVRPGDPGASGDMHGDWAAMNINALRFVGDHDVAVLGTDSTGDTFPLPFPKSPTIHILAEVYLGMPLMHSMNLEALADECRSLGRYEFMLMVAPLNIKGGTGSPVSPLCIL
jgi:kynurenine formamidase